MATKKSVDPMPLGEARDMWSELGGSLKVIFDEWRGAKTCFVYGNDGVHLGALIVFGQLRHEFVDRNQFMEIYRDERRSMYHAGEITIEKAFEYEAKTNPSIAQLVRIVREKEEEIRKLRK